jgi:hypothetical protein
MATSDRTRNRFEPRPARGAHDVPPAPARRTDWRAEVAGASGLNVLAGIWLIISPWVLSYRHGDAYWNPIVFGAIVGVFALVRIAGAYRESWLSYLNAAIGVWLFISAWWLADSSQAFWNVLISGVVVFVLGIISASATDEAAA